VLDQAKNVAHLANLWKAGSGWHEYVKQRVIELEKSYPAIRTAFKAAVDYDETEGISSPLRKNASRTL
jgi:hypothetical protein